VCKPARPKNDSAAATDAPSNPAESPSAESADDGPRAVLQGTTIVVRRLPVGADATTTANSIETLIAEVSSNDDGLDVSGH